jgi:hypothetical protein
MPAKFRGGGVGEYFTPDGVIAVETSTCAHCGRITEIPNRKRMADVVDFCRKCMRLICADCAGKDCHPIEKRVEEEEARYRLFKDMGLT